MRRRLGQIGSFFGLFALFFCGLGGVASAQPKVCGNQTPLGDWTLANCPTLKDDGVPPDDAAGDGIYSASVKLSSTALLEYKLLPNGTWDGSVEIREAGTCPFDGGATANSASNIQIAQPDVSAPTLFFYDSRSLADSTYSPAPGNRSGGDSAMLHAPAGTCPSFVAVGDFQNLVGPNSTAAPLVSQGHDVLVGRITADKALAAGWGWKVVQKTTGVAREYGPTGWAYAPCTAVYGTVAQAVAVGDSVYFLFHAQTGRLQTIVSSTPLDGFSPDGAASCLPAADMTAPHDLWQSAADLATGSAPDDLAITSAGDLQSTTSADGGMMAGRPGIHCDCQIGRAAVTSASASERNGLLWLIAAGLGLLARRRRGRSGALQPQRLGVKGD